MRSPSPASVRRVLRARDVLGDRFDARVTIDDLAREARLSRAFLIRAFASTFGETPHQYQQRLRLERAKRMLARGRSVTEACLDVGFASPTTFSALFSRTYGVSPRAWQKRARTVVAVRGLPALWVPGCLLALHAGHAGHAGTFEEVFEDVAP